MKYEGHPDDCDCDNCTGYYKSHNKVVYHTCIDCRTHIMNSPYSHPITKESLLQHRRYEPETGMATINLCDRCDTMYTSACATILSITTNASSDRRELCPGCVQDVIAMVDSKPTTERPRAYKSFPDPAENGEQLRLDKGTTPPLVRPED